MRLYTYNPYGEVIESSHEPQATSNSFLFTGQYYDSEIDEYFMRARMYDPRIGRFTSRDPVFGKAYQPLTLHQYLYCLNDPVNYIDPSGKFYWFADMLVSDALSNSLRIMDYKFHKNLFDKSAAKIDAFSIANLQRGITMDLFVASLDTDLKTTVRDAGIEALGLYSENLGRLAGFLVEVYGERKAIWAVLQGEEQLDDYIGFRIGDAIATTATEDWID